MKAVVIHEYGDASVVRHVEIERPSPRAGEVLVQVRAAGVNPVDWKIRGGLGQRLGLTLPIQLGGEIAGIVAGVGADVTAFAVGDEVFGIIPTGGFSDYAIASVGDLAPKPASIDFEQAAAYPLGALTAWQAIFELADLRSGQRLLVTGASGGVGSLAVQLAKAKGAYVIGNASGRNADFVRELGADEMIDYTTQRFEDVVHDVDVVFDTVGGDTFERAFRTLKRDGVLVTAVAFPTAERADEFAVRALRVFCKPNAEQLGAIGALVESGALRAHVATVLPVASVNEALALSETGRTRGKIVLRIS